MYRTPARKALILSDSSPDEPPRATVAQARRSFEPQPDGSNSKPAGPARQVPKLKAAYKSRMTEATALLNKIRASINASRNTKNEIKNEVTESASRLWQMIKDAEEGRTYKKIEEKRETGTQTEQHEVDIGKEGHVNRTEKEKELAGKLEDHMRTLVETREIMERVKEEICRHKEETIACKTYASAVSGTPKAITADVAPALHSIIVTSSDDQLTGEEVVEKIRRAARAREDGIRVDRVRKAKDRKVILGCHDIQELKKIKENIKKNDSDLIMEEIKNKDPLIIIKDLLNSHTNEEIVNALKAQNKHLLQNIPEEQLRMEVRHRRKTRNAMLAHIIVRVSPQIWRQLVGAGAAFIDVQRVRVEDQSPVVQCSNCLGFGHGRRFCHEPLEACSHCGGPHKKAQCADWLAAATPTCCNCQRARLSDVSHNAFAGECPVRKKWDKLARSSIAYS